MAQLRWQPCVQKHSLPCARPASQHFSVPAPHVPRVCVVRVRVLQGWGTVRFATTEAATAAIEQFHGSQLEGRTLTVFLDKKA